MTDTPAPKQPTVAVPVSLTKGFASEHWCAEVGTVSGYGHTQAAAKADLVANLLTRLARWHEPPAFATDDDGTIIVAVPSPYGGADLWRWPPGEAPRMTTTTTAAPTTALANVPHYTPAGARP